MSKHFYIQNAAPEYTGTTLKGTYGGGSASTVWKACTPQKRGATGTVGPVTITGSTNVSGCYMALAIKVGRSGTILSTDTISFCYGFKANVGSFFNMGHFIWVAAGNTTTSRGTIRANAHGSSFAPTTASFNGFDQIPLTSLAVTAGDFIIIEIGSFKTSSTATNNVTAYFGGTGADAPEAAVAPGGDPTANQVGHVEFNGTIATLVGKPNDFF